MELSNPERIQVVSALLAAKCQSEKSHEICQLEVINKVIDELSTKACEGNDSPLFFEPIVARKIMPSRVFKPMIEALADLVECEVVVSKEEAKLTLDRLCFPYRMSETDVEQTLDTIFS